MTASRVTADDFFAGLFSALALQGLTTLSIRVDQFDPAIKGVVDELQRTVEESGLRLAFRVRLHPVHRDSLTIQSALARAAQRDLVSFDNPEYQDIQIKLAPLEAEHVLNRLPGGRGLYEHLAEKFVTAYNEASVVAPA